jgi:hypothetical protein
MGRMNKKDEREQRRLLQQDAKQLAAEKRKEMKK